MISDILVHIDGTSAGKRRLAYVFKLAEQHRAHLIGVHVTPPPDVPPYYKPSKVERVAMELKQQQAADARAAEETFRSAAAAHSPPVSWYVLKGHMAPQICQIARCADLVVLGQYEREGSVEHHPLSLAEAVVVDCGRPVLVVPANIEAHNLRHVLIAWDGSREAVRAVHDALPILCEAKATAEIAVIDKDDVRAGLPSLIEHLKRHHIVIKGEPHIHAQGTTANNLVERLKQRHFDLLVMGAFGHPVWFEFLFRGTTPSVLLNASIPVLVSH